MKNLFLSLSIIILMGCSQKIKPNENVVNTQVMVTNSVQKITVEAFNDLLSSEQNLQLLDVRTPEEFSQGHIKGAENQNLHDENFINNVQHLDKSKSVYVYCRVGGRSAKAAEILKNNGFEKIYDISGGIVKWTENGYNVAK